MYPQTGKTYYWRFKSQTPGPWRFGFCAGGVGDDLIRMGSYYGDFTGGSVVSCSEIEWKEYQ